MITLPHEVLEQLEPSRIAHAYIIESGGQEKRHTVAHGLARVLLCSAPNIEKMQACGQCHSCALLKAGTHPDLLELGNQGTSVGVDEVRQVSTMLTHTPQLGRSQVVVVNQANKMTENAANAILKTLEEPSGNAYLFLLTENRNQLMPTIRSRCQFLTLSMASRSDLKSKFEGIPEYVFGFVSDDEEKVQSLIDSGQIDALVRTYEGFIQSLKSGVNKLSLDMADSDLQWFEPFVLYLMQRRARQLIIKGNHQGALNCIGLIAAHQNKAQMQMGINRALAMSGLIQTGLPLLR